jgi:membrane protein required for colicin V production
MHILHSISSFDLVVVGIGLFFMIRGVWIGFMRQLAAFLALVGSYWIAGRYSGMLVPYVRDYIANPKMVFYASVALLFCISAILFILAGKVLQKVMEISLLGWFDRFLGLLLGAVKAAVLTSFLYLVLASSLSSTNDLLRRSATGPYLAQGAALLHQLIQDPQLRHYFVPKKPAIAEDKPPARDRKKPEAGSKKQSDR